MKRVYLITGASSGFGRALAEAVLEKGERAVLVARRAEALDQIAQRYPEEALAVTTDVTDAAARTAAVEQALEKFGRIDVLANIAGTGSLGAFEEFSPEQVRQQMEINFFAVAEMTRAVLPTMRKQRSGCIVNLTSVGGIVAFGSFSAYCAAKFAVEGFSEALRDEVKPLGIHVMIVEPGAFRTEFAGDVNMRAANTIEDYRQVVEPVRQYLYGSNGKQPGDPRKAAAVIIQAIEDPRPPLRLMLGADAFGLWEKKKAELERDFTRWQQLGEATKFEGAKVTPVGG